MMSNESVYSGGEISPIVLMQTMFERLRESSGGSNDEYDLDLTKVDIHKIVYEIQTQHNYPFEGFYFNGSRKFPFSQTIEDVLYEMTVCGKLTRPNPTMAKYNFISLSSANYDALASNVKTAVDIFVDKAKNFTSVAG